MVRALVMLFGWLECVVVVCALQLALEQGSGHSKQQAIPDPEFALGANLRAFRGGEGLLYRPYASSHSTHSIPPAQSTE